MFEKQKLTLVTSQDQQTTKIIPRVIDEMPANVALRMQGQQHDAPKLIESVPGMPPAESSVPSRHIRLIPEDEFRGGPRKVAGHPTNPATQASELFMPDDDDIESSWSKPTVHVAGKAAVADVINPATDVIPTAEDIN